MTETLKYKVELDTMGLQEQVQRTHSTIGMGVSALMGFPAQAMGTGGLAFNTALADLRAAQTTFASQAPSFGSMPFGIGPGGTGQFFDPAAQAGFFQGAGMRMGLISPPRNALFGDVMAVGGHGMGEFADRAAMGMGLRFAFPTAVGAVGAGIGRMISPRFGPWIGGIGAAMLAGSIGESAYESFVGEREREMIFRGTGTPDDLARPLARGVTMMLEESRFSQVQPEELTRFVSQQAFSRRMGPNTQQQVEERLQQIREDLEAVTQIQGSLNLTFDAATDLLGQMQGVGVGTRGPGPSVMDVLSRSRGLGALGFTPGQQRQVVAQGLQSAQAAAQQGAVPDEILRNIGGVQARGAELLRIANLATDAQDPLFQLARMAPSSQAMAGALERGTRGLAGLGFVQQGMLLALANREEGETVSDAMEGLPDILKGGPTAAMAGLSALQTRLGPLRAGLAIRGAQRLLPAATDVMVNQPGMGVEVFRAFGQQLNRGRAEGAKLSPQESAQIFQEMTGIDTQAMKAIFAEFQNASKMGFDSWRQAQEEAASLIHESGEKIASSLDSIITGALRTSGGELSRYLGSRLDVAFSKYAELFPERREGGAGEGPVQPLVWAGAVPPKRLGEVPLGLAQDPRFVALQESFLGGLLETMTSKHGGINMTEEAALQELADRNRAGVGVPWADLLGGLFGETVRGGKIAKDLAISSASLMGTNFDIVALLAKPLSTRGYTGEGLRTQARVSELLNSMSVGDEASVLEKFEQDTGKKASRSMLQDLEDEMSRGGPVGVELQQLEQVLVDMLGARARSRVTLPGGVGRVW